MKHLLRWFAPKTLAERQAAAEREDLVAEGRLVEAKRAEAVARRRVHALEMRVELLRLHGKGHS